MTVVIFDLDGTLIDSAPDIHATANRTLIAEGFAALPFAQVRSYIGKGVPHLMERLLEASGQEPRGAHHSPMLARFNRDYESAVGLTRPYPGVVAALDALAALGLPMGICTNKPLAPTRAVLRHLGFDHYFSAVFGGDSFAVRKPDAAPLLATLAALGGGPAVYVGDSEIDALTATAAALPFALYTEGYRKSPVAEMAHDAAFADFAELAGIVQRLAPGSAR